MSLQAPRGPQGNASGFFNAEMSDKGLFDLLHQLVQQVPSGPSVRGSNSEEPQQGGGRPPEPVTDEQYMQVVHRITGNNHAESSPRKTPRTGGIAKNITIEDVFKYIDLPAGEACKRLGIGLTSFKRACRRLGIKTWPYRVGKQVDKEEVVRQILQNSQLGNGLSSELSKDVLDALDEFSSHWDKDSKSKLFKQVVSILELSNNMRRDCKFSIFNDVILVSMLTRLAS